MADKWKQYLGDGVYVDFDGYAIVLTTENGIEQTNRIVLEPDVYSNLEQYAEHLDTMIKNQRRQGGHNE